MSILELNRAAERAYRDFILTHRGINDSASKIASETGLDRIKILEQVSKLCPNMRNDIAILTKGKIDHTI